MEGTEVSLNKVLHTLWRFRIPVSQVLIFFLYLLFLLFVAIYPSHFSSLSPCLFLPFSHPYIKNLQFLLFCYHKSKDSPQIKLELHLKLCIVSNSFLLPYALCLVLLDCFWYGFITLLICLVITGIEFFCSQICLSQNNPQLT